MGSRGDSEDQEMDTHYSPPDTLDFETQQLIARLDAEEEIAKEVADQVVNDGKKQGSKRRLISLVDSEDDSDVEITPATQKSKPRRKTSFGTASQKPMFQSTLDVGIGSSAQERSQKKYVPMKAVIRGGRRKPSIPSSSSRSRKNKSSSYQSQKKKTMFCDVVTNAWMVRRTSK